jgi:hypothetical protein
MDTSDLILVTATVTAAAAAAVEAATAAVTVMFTAVKYAIHRRQQQDWHQKRQLLNQSHLSYSRFVFDLDLWPD